MSTGRRLKFGHKSMLGALASAPSRPRGADLKAHPGTQFAC